MVSELQAIFGPEMQSMLLVNGATALFALSLIVVTLFRAPERSPAPVALRV